MAKKYTSRKEARTYKECRSRPLREAMFSVKGRLVVKMISNQVKERESLQPE